jgi:hypothetical protein
MLDVGQSPEMTELGTSSSRSTQLSRRTVIIVLSVVVVIFAVVCASVGAWPLVIGIPLGLIGLALFLIIFRLLYEFVVIPVLFLLWRLGRRALVRKDTETTEK